MSQENNKNKKKMTSFNLLVPSKNEENSVSILPSNLDLQQIDNILKEIQSKQEFYMPNYINRQISTGLIVDWQNFQNQHAKGHLIVKDGDDSQKTVFSYLILSKHTNGQPNKVIYRWIKRFPKRQSQVCLEEQQHIYHGLMKNKKKHGEAQYIILRKYSDNKKYQQLIKGIWNYDILINGKVIDNLGNQKSIVESNMSLKSKRQIGFVQQNKQIRLQTRKLSTKLFRSNNKITNQTQSHASGNVLKLLGHADS